MTVIQTIWKKPNRKKPITGVSWFGYGRSKKSSSSPNAYRAKNMVLTELDNLKPLRLFSINKMKIYSDRLN